MSEARVALGAMVLAAGLLSGCVTLGPDYRRPEVGAPESYRGEAPSGALEGAGSAGAATTAELAQRDWRSLFADEALRELVEKAFEGNLDLRIAAARRLQAEALYGVARSDRYPALEARAGADRERSSSGAGDGSKATTEAYLVGVGLSWELDFWGRFRRASESARAQMLAAEWGRHAVATSLVADVANGYFTLRALDRELEIARGALDSREESLRLTRIREEGGAASMVDVRQAEQLIHAARATQIDAGRRIAQQENYLSVLLGANPGEIRRGLELADQRRTLETSIPAGLPSSLLERRPDVRRAEALLASATADIGVAKASYFPRIALTGFGGTASGALSDLFKGPAGIWSAAASAVAPLFNAGRTRSEVAYAEARRDEATAIYEQTVRTAFREVADALVEFRSLGELGATQRALVESADDVRRLAEVRYRGGAASYFEVLDSETRLFEANLSLVRVELSELTAFVEIYRALGGGWQPLAPGEP